MIHLTKVLPVNLMLSKEGKKIPVGGMKKTNRIDYEPGMKNFAIYMEDYSDIVVLDLDTRDHPLIEYTNMTYTHRTRKGWHCFFKNTFDLKNKRQKQKEKFDLLAGPNWIFYNYNDPEVAQYTEYNDLPLIDMPSELYDMIKHTAQDLGEDIDKRFIPKPLVNMLKSKKSNLWEHGLKGAPGHWKIDNSSDLAYAITMQLLPYTDTPQHLKAVFDEIDEIGDKHSQPDYLARLIKTCKRKITETVALSWQPLSDFRACSLGGKYMYADIDKSRLEPKGFVDFVTAPGVDISLLDEYVEAYKYIVFDPALPSKFNKDEYNVFNGFIPEEEGTGHEDFLNYVLEVICSDNDEHYTYLLKYMAHMVQKPEERPDVSLVFYGHDKGTGKDTFHELLAQVFNPGAYVKLSEESLLGRFNSQLEACLLGVAEELVFGGSHKEDSRLKAMITSSKRNIERKGFDSYEVDNYIRLVITSNSSRPVRATKGERRFFAVQPSKRRKNDFDYWSRLRSDFRPEHLLYYLRRVNLDGFQVRDYPYSKGLDDIINQNKDQMTESLELWWDLAYDGDKVDTQELYDAVVGDHNKYTTKRQLTSKMFEVCGKHHFRKTQDKGKNIYVVQGHRTRPESPNDGLDNMPEVP